MNTPSQGATCPFSHRIDAALLLAEAATATLEKRPSDEAIENAAHALIRAGVGLLSIADEVYIIDGKEQGELYGALVNAAEALDLATSDAGMPDGPSAVVKLVKDHLGAWAERLAFKSLLRVGLEDPSHA